MRKKDYAKSFNFFEYEQQLNKQKNADKNEIRSVEELTLLDNSFSVVNAPETTVPQNDDDVFCSVFDVNKKNLSNVSDVFEASTNKDGDAYDEIIAEKTGVFEERNDDNKEIFVADEQTTDNVLDETASEESNLDTNAEEEQFEFDVQTVTPIAEAPKRTIKVKNSFLKVFKKQKTETQEEIVDEFFVEPVVNSIEEITKNQEDTAQAENQVLEENNQISGQQFFAEAIMDEIPELEFACDENIDTTTPVLDESDEIFAESTEEEQEIFEEHENETKITDEPVFDKVAEVQPIAYDETTEENPYNIILEEEPEHEQEELQENPITKLISYEELKKTKLSQFETPYLFKGEKGEHIRFRITSIDEPGAKKARALQIFKEYAILIASAVIIGLFLNFFIFTFAHVNGSSMEPTLHSKQVTLVSRLEYKFSEIERGDIVITRYPSQAYPDMYIKRVIALPNENIEIIGGIVYVNGKALEEDYVLPDPLCNMPLTHIPENCVFVMGDNRPDSADSRIVGVIPTNKIIGKAKFIVFPTLKNIED